METRQAQGLALEERIVERAHQLGFDLVCIAAARQPTTADYYRAWLDKGYHAAMAYLSRPDAVAKREDPRLVQPGLRTTISVAANHHTITLPADMRSDASRGIIASYAWNQDYHDLMTPRLCELGIYIEAQVNREVAHRAYVDTGPLLERDMAASGGLGFVGKNTNLINPGLGSWLFLGELLVTADLHPRVSHGPAGALARLGTCGQCTRCLAACPTRALVSAYDLDARLCISYLTIENKGPIPRDLRPLMGNRIFGCDICQEVCPWNRRFARPTLEPAFQPQGEATAPKLLDLLALDEQGFRQRFRGSPIKRSKRRGLLRNVAVALGNWGDPAAAPALGRALADPEPLIRGHAAWALGRIDGPHAPAALSEALEVEQVEWVREELAAALNTLSGT